MKIELTTFEMAGKFSPNDGSEEIVLSQFRKLFFSTNVVLEHFESF